MTEPTIDWTQYSVQLATPCMDGKYERRYVKSLMNTMFMAHTCGAKFDWAEVPYNSEISCARAKIFGNFFRSGCTHLMMIDADMGWAPNDIFRLLHAGRDFIGAAGPKKLYTQDNPSGLSFAFNNSDDAGNPQPILMEAGPEPIIEVTEVGGAFMLMSKACAEKMAAAYPETKFTANNFTEYGVYDPMIVDNGRRLAEDYSFCRRWRNIGGKVNLLIDARLDHVGSHTWSGALEQSLPPAQDISSG